MGLYEFDFRCNRPSSLTFQTPNVAMMLSLAQPDVGLCIDKRAKPEALSQLTRKLWRIRKKKADNSG